MLNVDGQTPLHKAAEKYFAEVAKMLLTAAPPSVIYMEDCVGHTVLETAILRELKKRIDTYRQTFTMVADNEIQLDNYAIDGKPLDVFLDNEQCITDMLSALESSRGEHCARVLETVAKWVTRRDALMAERKARKAHCDEEELAFNAMWRPWQAWNDTEDVGKTLEYIRKAEPVASAMAIVPPRRLIHPSKVSAAVGSGVSVIGG